MTRYYNKALIFYRNTEQCASMQLSPVPTQSTAVPRLCPEWTLRTISTHNVSSSHSSAPGVGNKSLMKRYDVHKHTQTEEGSMHPVVLKVHLKTECEEVLEQCPNKCGERVPRKDVSVSSFDLKYIR